MLRGLKEGVGVVLKGWMRVRFCACYARSAAYGWSEGGWGCARDGGVLEGGGGLSQFPEPLLTDH